MFPIVALAATIISTAAPIQVSGTSPGRTFDGIGALSAGASSRLLIDYPEAQRSEILDYLFKPNFGAALQINKVEIGGDMNSTDGAEPSHMRTPEDANYHRGYEWWLMEESKKRNPDIKLYGLEWGAPHWINPKSNNVWTPENITYIVNWVQHAKSDHNLAIDYLGGWNERGNNPGWYKSFRSGLDKAGLQKVTVVADDSFHWKVGLAAAADPAFANSFQIVGMHYPPGNSGTTAEWHACYDTGKPLWASEIGSNTYNGGAANLAKLYNRGYIDQKMSAYINWSTIWSVLPGMPYPGCGLMLADQPWSGHYQVGLSIWTTAHTTQFAQPGWRYIDSACAYFDAVPAHGSHIALRSPNGHDYSIIAETIGAVKPQTASFAISGGLDTGALHVWRTNVRSTNEKDWFVQQPDIPVQNGSFTATFDPNCVYSLTTTTGQSKGVTSIPPSAPFPLPYKENFQGYPIGATPRYFSDQHGAFEIAPATHVETTGASNPSDAKCLRQVITEKPVTWNSDADPGTLIGDQSWKDYTVSSDILLEEPGYLDLIGRIMTASQQNRITGYHFRVTDKGHWTLFVRTNDKKVKEITLGTGDLQAPVGINHWHAYSLAFKGSQITASLDNTPVTTVSDATFPAGMAGYQVNRWQTAEFKNFQAVPAQ